MRRSRAHCEHLTVAACDDFCRGRDRRAGVNSHEHHTVSEPFRDHDTASRGDLADRCAKRDEKLDRRMLAVRCCVEGESAKVDERKGTVDERHILHDISWSMHSGAFGGGSDAQRRRRDDGVRACPRRNFARLRHDRTLPGWRTITLTGIAVPGSRSRLATRDPRSVDSRQSVVARPATQRRATKVDTRYGSRRCPRDIQR